MSFDSCLAGKCNYHSANYPYGRLQQNRTTDLTTYAHGAYDMYMPERHAVTTTPRAYMVNPSRFELLLLDCEVPHMTSVLTPKLETHMAEAVGLEPTRPCDHHAFLERLALLCALPCLFWLYEGEPQNRAITPKGMVPPPVLSGPYRVDKTRLLVVKQAGHLGEQETSYLVGRTMGIRTPVNRFGDGGPRPLTDRTAIPNLILSSLVSQVMIAFWFV